MSAAKGVILEVDITSQKVFLEEVFFLQSQNPVFYRWLPLTAAKSHFESIIRGAIFLPKKISLEADKNSTSKTIISYSVLIDDYS